MVAAYYVFFIIMNVAGIDVVPSMYKLFAQALG
jgi:hypothetical protein